VRVRAAHHHGVGLPRQVDVVGVAARAAHQGRILGAPHRLTDAELLQGPAAFGVKIHAIRLGFRLRLI
jgi:hypothetical protein